MQSNYRHYHTWRNFLEMVDINRDNFKADVTTNKFEYV